MAFFAWPGILANGGYVSIIPAINIQLYIIYHQSPSYYRVTLKYYKLDSTLPQQEGKNARFSSCFADISAGNIGTGEGFTTLIIRNDSGKALVLNAVEMGNITLSGNVDESAIEEAERRKKSREQSPVPYHKHQPGN